MEPVWRIVLRSNVILLGVLLFGLALPVWAQPSDVELGGPVAKASPPLPDLGTFPVQLVLDDDSAEAAFGFPMGGARQFLWLNSFPNPGSFTLEEVWVLFSDESDVPLGGAVQIVVFQDPDGDPSNGATLLATYDETIQAVDGNTFSVYPLAAPLEITGAGDILIGVVNRYFVTGSPSATRPAAFDSTLSQGRSYFALWAGDPPNPPDLATATTVDVLAGAATGNFMIRGFGSRLATTVIPTLDGWGLALLGTFLGLAGAAFLARRRP